MLLIDNFDGRMHLGKYILILILFIFPSGKVAAQYYQESMEERANQSKTYEGFLVDEIRRFPEVKQTEAAIRRSGNTLTAIYMIESDGLGTYTVKILEDKGGKNQVLKLKYVVDSASGRILNKDAKLH